MRANPTKRYGRLLALDGLDLSVAAGQVFEFLGPNGAGTSATIRLLLGLARPTVGRARETTPPGSRAGRRGAGVPWQMSGAPTVGPTVGL
ncbi:ATP-binding cassette domain-containing protein [Pseudonocardia humida]|uniref:ATP-binding cassette domain-containing protein n=1 Tax=Pseudonocardia humida TaxID=2800819 RepID=UPI0027E3207D|nr:ATP-binding cassette domain-containing protein [Pseudonocardia humida]